MVDQVLQVGLQVAAVRVVPVGPQVAAARVVPVVVHIAAAVRAVPVVPVVRVAVSPDAPVVAAVAPDPVGVERLRAPSGVRVANRRVGASPSAPSAKSSTTCKPPRWVAPPLRWVTAKPYACRAVRR